MSEQKNSADAPIMLRDFTPSTPTPTASHGLEMLMANMKKHVHEREQRITFSPAGALWNNRHDLAKSWGKFRRTRSALQEAMGGPRDFLVQQPLQIASMVYDFKPDLIVELGRGYGNSTCAMAHAAGMLSQPCRFVSLCLSHEFNTISLPHLRRHLLDLGALNQVEALETDILSFDFDAITATAKRVFIFWDAHGFDVAQTILTRLLRPLHDRPHLAVIHDMADLDYMPDGLRRFGTDEQWLRYGTMGPKYILGSVGAQYEEGVALVDFASRNNLKLRSAESSYFADLNNAEAQELGALFGDDFSRYGFWYHLTLNGLDITTLSFPKV